MKHVLRCKCIGDWPGSEPMPCVGADNMTAARHFQQCDSVSYVFSSKVERLMFLVVLIILALVGQSGTLPCVTHNLMLKTDCPCLEQRAPFSHLTMTNARRNWSHYLQIDIQPTTKMLPYCLKHVAMCCNTLQLCKGVFCLGGAGWGG